MAFGLETGPDTVVNIKVIGVGGAGNNVVNRMVRSGAKGVEWDRLFKATDKDGVKWYVVECERHAGSLAAVKPSFEFLKSKGRG